MFLIIYQKLYPQGKEKALTFSYDDGVCQDLKLLELFDRYGVKGTFNLNSWAQPGDIWEYQGVTVDHISLENNRDLFRSHEVAVHTCTHPRLETLDKRRLYMELYEDRRTLSECFRTEVTGMALPYGSWNDEVLEAVKMLEFQYCRTTKSTHSFAVPDSLPLLNPTCRHADPELPALAQKFCETKEELALFYVWGHSYEFDGNHNWEIMENLLKTVSGRQDTWYASNGEIIAYLNACDHLVAGDHFFLNPTKVDLWVKVGETVLQIPPEKWINLPG